MRGMIEIASYYGGSATNLLTILYDPLYGS